MRGERSARLWKRAFPVSGLPLLALTGALLPALAAAQSDAVLEEVIVTVNRRVQNLQDYSGVVQALNGEDLQRLNVTNDFTTLQHAISGLHISNQEGKLEVFLRGIGSSDSDFASDPSVATHYNGVYLPRPRSIGPMFFDVDRVEVAKGPQGTLRGRNATGGTINIISKRPSFGDLDASFLLGAGDYEQRHAEAVVNVPVGETLAVRLAGYLEERDSYMDNAFIGSAAALANLNAQGERIADAFAGSIDAPGAIDDKALRLSAFWQPTDSFSAFLLADVVEQRGSSVPGAFSGRSLSFGSDIDDLDDPYRQYFVNEGAMRNDIEGVSGTLAYDFGRFTLEYNGSWREYDFQHRNAAREWQIGMDFPGARTEAEAVILGNEQTAYGNFTQAEVSQTTVHELRLFANDSERFRWTAGAFLLEEDFSWASQDFNHGWWGDCDWFQAGTVCGWLNGLSSENRNDDSEVESTAFYTDATFDVSDRFRLIAGVRHTDDEKIARESNANYQLVLTDAALASLGLSGPQDIVMGTTGLVLTRAAERSSALVPLGNSAATRDYFLAGIASWGGRDNIDELIAFDPSLFQVVINSDFQRDLDGDGQPDPGTGNIVKRYSESYIDWRAGFEYDFSPDSLLYVTISTGTRSGGINRPLPGAAANADVIWDPEQLLVYEIGSKNVLTWGTRPVRLNAAAFFYDYDDKVLQGLVSVDCSSGLPGAPPCTVNHVQNQNAASARLYGIEVDSDILLPAGFGLRANLAYLDGEFKDGSVVVDTRRPGWLYGTPDPYQVDLGGNPLPNTSEWNATLALSQARSVNWGWATAFDATLSLVYRSEFHLSVYADRGYDANNNEAPMEQMLVNNHWLITGAGFAGANGNFMSDDVPSSTVLNFTAGLDFGSESRYRLEAWASNITDEAYSTKAFINESVNIRFLNTPRLYGVRFNARF